jgi:hypothetical protein
MLRGGSTYRRGGRQKGTPNKQSIPAIKAAIIRASGPKLDSLTLGRLAAAGILEEINKLRAAEKYKPAELVDWYVKLTRVAEGYISYEHPRVSPVEREDRKDYNVQVHAELSRLRRAPELRPVFLAYPGAQDPQDDRGLASGGDLPPPGGADLR